MSEDCIFCKIINGKLPSAKLYEDEKTFAFLDIAPNNKGHALVIPKTHTKDILDVHDDDLVAVSKTVKKIANAITKTFGPAFNLVVNNGKEAGQVVFHSHFHIIPRHVADGMKFEVRHLKYEENEMHEYAEKIKKHIK